MPDSERTQQEIQIRCLLPVSTSNIQHTKDAPASPHNQKELPDIVVSGKQLREITAEALDSLQAQDLISPKTFVRAGKLARINIDEEDRPVIAPVGDAELSGLLTRAANYYTESEKDGVLHHRPAYPPKAVVHDIQGLNPAHLPFRRLLSLIEAPIIRPDGTILSTPGYDPATRLYYAPQKCMERFSVPQWPTSNDMEQAKVCIRDSFGQFPYAGTAEWANAFGLMLTPLVRPLIQGHIPLAAISAAQRGSGKGLFSDGVSLIATGRPAAIFPVPGSEDEWDKRITGLLMAGSSMIIIDNVVDTLKSVKLDTVLTANYYQGRVLGTSTILSLPNRATWIATGNNLKLGGDLARRSYQIRLNVGTSRPWMRTGFKYDDLLAHLTETRAEHIAALLTLARYWVISGKPLDPSLPRLGTFTPWVQTIGGILWCAGVPDFLSNLDTLYDEIDDGETQWEAFLLAWTKAFGTTWVEVAEIVRSVKKAHDHPGGSATSEEKALAAALPTDLLQEFEEKPGSFSIRLGKALEKQVDACYGVDNLRLEKRADKHTKQNVWRVVAGSAGSARTWYVTEKGETSGTLVQVKETSLATVPEHSPHSPQEEIPDRNVASTPGESREVFDL